MLNEVTIIYILMGQPSHGPKLLFWWHFEKFPALFIAACSELVAHPIAGTQLDLNAATSQPETCSPPSPASFLSSVLDSVTGTSAMAVSAGADKR